MHIVYVPFVCAGISAPWAYLACFPNARAVADTVTCPTSCIGSPVRVSLPPLLGSHAFQVLSCRRPSTMLSILFTNALHRFATSLLSSPAQSLRYMAINTLVPFFLRAFSSREHLVALWETMVGLRSSRVAYGALCAFLPFYLPGETFALKLVSGDIGPLVHEEAGIL